MYPLPSSLFYMLCKCVTFRPKLHNAPPLHPSPSLLPHSELSNGFMKWAGEMMREIVILMVWHEALSQAPLINEFCRALALWWTILIRQATQTKMSPANWGEVRGVGGKRGHVCDSVCGSEWESCNSSVCGQLVCMCLCMHAHREFTWYPLWVASNGGLSLWALLSRQKVSGWPWFPWVQWDLSPTL